MEQYCSFWVFYSQHWGNPFRDATCVPTLLPRQVEPKPISVWLSSLLRHSSGNPGLRARPCSCTTKHKHLILLSKSHLCCCQGGIQRCWRTQDSESALGKSVLEKFSISPMILPGVLWQFPILSHPPPNGFLVVKLIRDADEAPNTYCSAPASSKIICQSSCRV